MGRRGKSRGPWRGSPGPLLLACFAGAIGLLVLLSHADWRPLLGSRSGSGEGGRASSDRASSVAAPADPLGTLAQVLEGRAEWDRPRAGAGDRWSGRIEGMSLVRWNGETTAALERAGLEVLAGREELVERRGRWPLQRLTLDIGAGGRKCAVVVVETSRDPSLPAGF